MKMRGIPVGLIMHLLECNIEVGDVPNVHWEYTEAIHYNINDNTDYTQYIASLEEAFTKMPLHTFTQLSVEEMLSHITDSINTTAMSTFGIKVRKVKSRRKLPGNVIKMIRKKNSLAARISQLRVSNCVNQVEDLEEQLVCLKSDIKDSLSSLKLKRRQKLRSKLLLADPNRKKFRRFLKSQIKSAGNITAAYDKAGSFNHLFLLLCFFK